MIKLLFKGSGVALVTPFDQNNHINFDEVSRLIEFHIQNHSDAIIICGTTGESATLSQDEKKQLIQHVVKVADTRIPIIAGTGSNDTKKAIEMSKYAQSVGADGLLLVTPYYNKCTQKGLYEHYATIAKEVTLPIILYNVPSRTNVDISVETIIKLANITNVCGIKEASTDLVKIANIIHHTPDDFSLYSGNDDLLLPILSLGGDGVISVAANIIPSKIHDICYHMLKGNVKEAKNLYITYLALIESLFIEVNPIPIKYVMNRLSYSVGSLRLPLTTIDEKHAQIIETKLKEAKLI